MFETKTKTIDGTIFRCKQLPAIEALRLKARLMKIFSPSVAQGISAFSSVEGLESQFNGRDLAEALAGLFEILSEDDFVALIREMLKNVSFETKDREGRVVELQFHNDFEAKMDLAFQGRLMLIYQVMLLVLETNYPDFFEKLGNIGSRLKTALSKPEDVSTKTP